MKKTWIALLLAACLLLSACGAGGAEPNSPSETAVTFTDDLGRTVTVDRPRNVAALLGSFAQVWMLAGGTVHATVDDAWEDLALDLPEDAVNLGGSKDASLEKLLESQPDFVLASTNTRVNMEMLDILEAAGIPAAYFNIDDFDDYLRILSVCTDITGRKDLYEQHGTAVQQQIDAVLERSRARVEAEGAPEVLCMVASASAIYAKNSRGNVLGAALEALGCSNIADANELLLENISIEHILQSDPDYIFFVQRGDDAEGMRTHVAEYLTEHPAWRELTAVKNGRVYFMEKNLFNLKPNHRWGEAYEILEEILSNG